jgi:hypothetical protein
MTEMRTLESATTLIDARKGIPTEETRQRTLLISEDDHPELEAAGLVPSVPRTPGWRAKRIAAVVTCTLLLAVAVVAAKWHKSELDLLWNPIIESKKTVFLYTGTLGPLYRREVEPVDKTKSVSDLALPAVPPPLSPIETQEPNARVFESIGGNLVPTADIAADLKIAALMNSYNRTLSLRTGDGLQFADLKGSPAVLIGAYDNYWTLELARELPFYLDRGVRIRERSGQHRVWSGAGGADNTLVEDYAIVFRLVDSKTGGPVLAIAGLTTCATQAAAEFTTDPVQLRKLAGIPRDVLAHGNVEFVLRASLVNCTPASTEIVAQQYW